MSFILDALKKSEGERQQQNTAEFGRVQSQTAAAPVPRWLWVVGLLLAVNLAVLIGLLLRPNEAPAQRPGTLNAPQSAARERPPDAILAEPGIAEQIAEARRNAPLQMETSNATPSVAKIAPVVIAQDTEALKSADLYPSIHEVRASGAISLAELHLDLHFYSDSAKDRFVFINKAKYREGAQLAEGPVIVEITESGVVLAHQGQNFVLSRE